MYARRAVRGLTASVERIKVGSGRVEVEVWFQRRNGIKLGEGGDSLVSYILYPKSGTE
jgi:hypothetical protein